MGLRGPQKGARYKKASRHLRIVSPSGHPKVGGRIAGTPNKVTSDLRAAAKMYTTEALDVLVEIMRTEESAAERQSAVKEILNRGWGKSVAQLTIDAVVSGSFTFATLNGMSDEELGVFIDRFMAEVWNAPERVLARAAADAELERMKSVVGNSPPMLESQLARETAAAEPEKNGG
jgi:hypothetical protein